jgi:hypothetical protein
LRKQKQGKKGLFCKSFGKNLLEVETEVSIRNIVENIEENCKDMI